MADMTLPLAVTEAAYLNLPMATDNLLFVAFGVALFYLKLNPHPVKRRDQLTYAWWGFFTSFFLVFGFAMMRAWNTSDDPATLHVYRIVEVWAQAISWLVLGVSMYLLYNALTPFTSKPEKAAHAADRHGRRARSDSNENAVSDAGAARDREADRRESRTPMEGSQVSGRRFGMDAGADLPDPVLEAKVEDELSSEPELVLSKEDELAMEPDGELAPLPPLAPAPAPEIIKVKTVAASISGSRAALTDRDHADRPERPERPKTEVKHRPRSEIIPVAQRTATNIPAGSGSRTAIPALGTPLAGEIGGTSGSRTRIPVGGEPGSPATPVDPDKPISVPVKPAASRSGSRPAASGIRQAAQSGTVKSLPEGEPDTPSKDQYLDR